MLRLRTVVCRAGTASPEAILTSGDTEAIALLVQTSPDAFDAECRHFPTQRMSKTQNVVLCIDERERARNTPHQAIKTFNKNLPKKGSWKQP